MQTKQQGQLVRSLTLGSAIILVVSSVIGSGVYKKVAPMSAELLSPDLVLWAWILAGVISLCGALSNAEIAGMMAGSGGEYLYFRRIYGKFMAFLWGWSTFAVIKTAAVSSIAYVFSEAFNAIFHLPSLLSPEIEKIEIAGVFKPFENSSVKVLTITLILLLTFLNTRGLRGAAGLSVWITRLVAVGLAGVVVSGLLFGGGSWTNFQTPATQYVERSWFDFNFIKAMFAALLAAFWAYEGWNTVGFIGGEIKNPNRNLPLTLLFGMLIIIGVYALVNFTYLYVLPIDRFAEMDETKIAAIEVVRHFAGEIGVLVISVIILVTTLGCTNSTILMPPRVYQAMAQDGLFFKKAADIDPKYHTPNNAIWIQGVWACLLVLSGNFEQLTKMLIFAAFFFYGATALGVFVMRWREPNAERPYRVWGYPIVPALFVIFCAALIVITCIDDQRNAGIGVVLMLTGVPFYLYWNGKKKEV